MKSSTEIPWFPLLRQRQAFTLLEILVSVSVLVILMMFVARILSNTSTVTGNGMKRMNADAQARIALDRIALDISKMTQRRDLDFSFTKITPGNDEMIFYSESTGYFPSGVTSKTPRSNVSLVGYRIRNNQLERLSKGLVWNGVTSTTPGASGLQLADRPITYLPQTISSTWPTVVNGGTDPDFQVIAEQIFRLEFCFLLKNGTTAPVLSGNPYLAPHTATNLNGLSDVVAVVVTIAVLDSKSRAIVSDAKLSAAAVQLDDVDGTPLNHSPLKLWQANVIAGLDLPRELAANVRIYQRYCYLNR